jgi:hypothetical protein
MADKLKSKLNYKLDYKNYALPQGLIWPATAVVNGILYVIGGYNTSTVFDTVYAIDIFTGTVTTKQHMPTARYSARAYVYNNKIYVVGGLGTQGFNVFGHLEHEVYDIYTDSWSRLASLPDYSGTISAISGESAYILGESHSYKYNIINNTYSSLDVAIPFNERHNYYSNELIYNGYIYCFGTTSYRYSIVNNNFEQINANAALHGFITRIGSVFYLIAGENNGVSQYNADTNTSVALPNLPVNMNRGGIANVNGDIIIVGGYLNGTNPLSTIMEYVYFDKDLRNLLAYLTI